MSVALPVAAPVNLDHSAHYFVWGPFTISLPNLLVVLLMILLFVLAVVVPFPKGRDK